MNPKTIKSTPQAWETRKLGADPNYVGVADPTHEAALQDALALQAISIRLPQALIRQYKLIAEFHGIGYQPLMRDVLQRFVVSELKHILTAPQKRVKAISKPVLATKRKAA